MFHMLTCFNLAPGATIESFRHALDDLAAHLSARDLVASVGAIGRRQRDTIMDTDEKRNHEYFFLMSFTDRKQCDTAVSHVYRKEPATESLHHAAYRQITDPVFICWQDID